MQGIPVAPPPSAVALAGAPGWTAPPGGACGDAPAAALTASAAGVLAGPAIGRSTRRLIGSPQAGQKRSSLLWMAAHRGQALTPASRSTVTV